MAQTKPTAGQIARAIVLAVLVGPLVGFVLLILGTAIGDLTIPRRPQDVGSVNAVFVLFAVIWSAVAAWSAWRARRSTFWAAASAVSFVVAILLVTAVGLMLIFPSRNPEPWALLTAMSFAVCAYVIFVTFFLWGAIIGATHRR